MRAVGGRGDGGRHTLEVLRGVGALRPRLDDELWLEPRDDVAGRVVLLVGGEAADVVFVPVRRDEHVQRLADDLRDLLGDLGHEVLLRLGRVLGRAEVDEHVPVAGAAGIVERQQEAVAEPDSVAAQRQAGAALGPSDGAPS